MKTSIEQRIFQPATCDSHRVPIHSPTLCHPLPPSAHLVPQLPAPIGAPLADVGKLLVLKGEDAAQVLATPHAALKVPSFLQQHAQFSQVPGNGIGIYRNGMGEM